MFKINKYIFISWIPSIVITSYIFAVKLDFKQNEKNGFASNIVPEKTTPIEIADNDAELTYDFITNSTQRESITFIMGEDETETNNYYENANHYYRQHPEEETDYIVDHLRSFAELRDYLTDYPPVNGLPWGIVNVVVHSNEWTGLSMLVFPDGKRCTPKTVERAMQSGKLNPVPDEFLDAESEVNFLSCGLGRNEALLKILRKALGGDDGILPLVRSSKYFIAYDKPERQDEFAEKRLMDYWVAFHKADHYPGEEEMSKRLASRYPDLKHDWKTALKQSDADNPNGIFHYTFDVPARWVVTYASEKQRPNLDEEVKQMAWLKRQTALQKALQKYGIPMEHFHWEFVQEDYVFSDGTIEPAIVAKGKSTIVCVLKTVAAQQRTGAAFPDLNDEVFYACVD